MGEEWGSQQPFPFFCDFRGPLAEAVRAGRRREYAEAYAGHRDDTPDPVAAATFRSAIVDWDSCTTMLGKRRLDLVRRLLAVRRQEIVPRLAGAKFGTVQVTSGLLTAHWRMGDGSRLTLTANLGDQHAAAIDPPGKPIWGHDVTASLPRWSVIWRIE